MPDPKKDLFKQKSAFVSGRYILRVRIYDKKAIRANQSGSFEEQLYPLEDMRKIGSLRIKGSNSVHV